MRIDLNEINLDEVQEAMFRRRPGRYREPYIIDKLVYVPSTKMVKIYYYENENHQKSGPGFRPPPQEVPVEEFTELNRNSKIDDLLS